MGAVDNYLEVNVCYGIWDSLDSYFFFGSLVFSCSLRSNVARVYAGLFLARDFFSFNFWGLCFMVICF